MKTICALCDAHLSGAPNDTKISHGYCHTCADAMRRSMAGERVDMRFWEVGNRHNQCVIGIDQVDAGLIRNQAAIGRTEREIIS